MSDTMRLRSFTARLLRASRATICALAALGPAGCGAGDIVLSRAIGADTGREGAPYGCANGAPQCQAGAGFDPAREAMSGTRRLPLPNCPHGIEQIVIQQVSGTPTAYVQCAAPPNVPTDPGDNPLATPDGGG